MGQANQLQQALDLTKQILRAIEEVDLDTVAELDRQRQMLIEEYYQDGQQIDRWMEFVRGELAAGADQVPLGIKETLLFDQSTYTVERLADGNTLMRIAGIMILGMPLLRLIYRFAVRLNSAVGCSQVQSG